MAHHSQRRYKKKVDAAEGYLMLEMPDHALHELAHTSFPQEFTFQAAHLQGDAYRTKEEYSTALEHYYLAEFEKPNNVSLLLNMAWCLKRIDELQVAIKKTKRAYEASPEESIILYNLSCYYALANDKSQSLSWLGRALRMDEALTKLIPQETDFNSLRDDKDFLFVVETAGAEV